MSAAVRWRMLSVISFVFHCASLFSPLLPSRVFACVILRAAKAEERNERKARVVELREQDLLLNV